MGRLAALSGIHTPFMQPQPSSAVPGVGVWGFHRVPPEWGNPPRRPQVTALRKVTAPPRIERERLPGPQTTGKSPRNVVLEAKHASRGSLPAA